METDNTLNMAAGKKTKTFLTMGLKPNFSSLSEQYFSMQGRLIVAAEVITEVHCFSVADIEIRIMYI